MGSDVSSRYQRPNDYGGMGRTRNGPISKRNSSRRKCPSSRSGHAIRIYHGCPLPSPRPIRRGCSGVAAGRGAQTGTAGNAGYPLLSCVSRRRPGGNGSRDRACARGALGRRDVTPSGSGSRPFGTNAGGADALGARDCVGATGQQARDGRGLRSGAGPCAKPISRMLPPL
jgi:hypothetical protein